MLGPAEKNRIQGIHPRRDHDKPRHFGHFGINFNPEF